ncbi:hypothetical protein OSB04_014257 [Centaurea solstitialis]|uniref:Uncharacterized protein n=1 Tax=Centaurea solstitialis TaxID=347529 RepID=A0AA38TF33_9ASTR|nr:hypothetical protein OSB04_014257 [Centaurea solstitialis]
MENVEWGYGVCVWGSGENVAGCIVAPNMALTDSFLTVLEKCRISPPPNTVGKRSLPLTFLDLTWLPLHPIHQLFFFEFPHSKSHFIETVIPNLKHSLSITLQHFFPFAGNLIAFPGQNPRKPEIRHVEGDSIALTFAECSLDFNDLCEICGKPVRGLRVLITINRYKSYKRVPELYNI